MTATGDRSVGRIGGWCAAVALLGVAAGCGGGGRHPRITVDRAASLRDAPVAIEARGLRPGERVIVRASRRDANGTTWSSSGTFVADGHGVVDLGRDASRGGTYRGAHAMGLFWSMRPARGARETLLDPPPGRDPVTLSVFAGGKVVARRKIVRATRSANVRETRLRPGGSGLYGDFFAAPSRGSQPAVLVIGGSRGGLSTDGEAALLASHGYPALSLAYFREPGLPRRLREIPLEYFARALRWLSHRPGVDRRKIVAIGISRGSEAAQLLGVHYPRLVHAVVGYVPSSVVNVGLASPTDPAWHTSAWSLRGHPIPYVPRDQAGVANPGGAQDAIIPDERIRGPILLVSAQEDAQWPSSGYAQAIMSRLERHHFRFFHRDLDYPAAGHSVGLVIPNLALVCPRDVCPLGGITSGNAIGRADSWAALLRFLAGIRAGRPGF